ncbi:MAG: peptide chain release factor N(5)-glutamine methyltransferase [Deltaproteobacteria bacterium]|nr:peptide chain release factor N(5)-glutamine methyltransferase [Deltaproteobacteria bacterium]
MTTDAPPKTWTIASLVKWAIDDFRTRGIENPRLDAELIVAHALEIDRMRVILDGARPLDGAELALLRDLVKRRRAYEPVAYLRGEREFYGLRFRVDKRVLVPRPDTETLVDVALARSKHVSMCMRQLDLCTGSGCVAIAMAKQRPTAQVIATDLSPDALAVARDNALRLGAYNVGFLQGDLFGALAAAGAAGARPFDVITANPPYIPSGDILGLAPDVKDHEPKLALDGGEDGLVLVRKIVSEAPKHLEKGGLLAMEIDCKEAAETAELFAKAGFTDVRIARDLAKLERVVSGVFGEG